jgi:hypothetical protein
MEDEEEDGEEKRDASKEDLDQDGMYFPHSGGSGVRSEGTYRNVWEGITNLFHRPKRKILIFGVLPDLALLCQRVGLQDWVIFYLLFFF